MDSSRRIWSLVRRQALIVLALAAVAFIIWGAASHPAPFSSAEVKFTDLSKSGLAIVPASCPSTPDFPGQCDGTTPPANKCSLIPSSYQISPGDSATLSWNVSNSGGAPEGAGSLPIESANITPDAGDVGTAPSGSVTVTPSQTTDYVYTFSYSPAATLVGGHCDATVVVGGLSCPAGSYDNGTGQCTEPCQALTSPNQGFTNTCQCPAGFTAQGNECVEGGCPVGSTNQGGQCVGACAAPHNFCSGNTLEYGDNSYSYCAYGPVTPACTWGCNPDTSACNLAPGPQFLPFTGIGPDGTPFNSDGRLTAKPTLLQSGDRTTLYWNVQYVEPGSCSVKGTNGDVFTGTDSEGSGVGADFGSNVNSSGPNGIKSGPITSQTIYTLTCTGYDGSTLNSSVTVNIVPIFNEK